MQVAIATATEAVALPRVDCDAPVSINRVSRLQLWHIASFHGDSNSVAFWSEADIELRLSSGLTAQKPTAMTITPSKIKNPLSWIIF
jgi:hypothetical protein